jgi:hypothetical protein
MLSLCRLAGNRDRPGGDAGQRRDAPQYAATGDAERQLTRDPIELPSVHSALLVRPSDFDWENPGSLR